MKPALLVLILLILGGALFVFRSRLDFVNPPQLQTSSFPPSPAPSLAAQEQKWQDSQATSNGDDTGSLEKDINGTVIQSEDFSDLQ